jgi:hypothetical protein
MSKDHVDALIAQLNEVIDLIEAASANGCPSASYAADSVRRRRDDLLARLDAGDDMQLAMRLLDIVPNAKDLDGIGFDVQRHPTIADALLVIDVRAAQLADLYLGSDAP